MCRERDKKQDKEASFYKPNIGYTFLKLSLNGEIETYYILSCPFFPISLLTFGMYIASLNILSYIA